MKSTFSLFKSCIVDTLEFYEYKPSDIDYINLTVDDWMEGGDFLNQDDVPVALSIVLRRIDWANAWILPNGFTIVMQDGSQFIYNLTCDEYYSGWIHVPKPKRGKRKHS